MARNSAVLFSFPLVEQRRHIRVRCAVVSHAAHAVFLHPLIRHAVHAPIQRDRSVEVRFKRTDKHRFREHGAQRLNGCKIRPVVRRSCGIHVAHSLQYGLGQLMHTVVSAAEHGFETNAVNIRNGADRAALGIRQIAKEAPDAGFVVRDGLLFLAQRYAARGVIVFIDCVVRAADALHTAGGEHLFGGHIVELEFKRGASGIADEYFHGVWLLFLFCTIFYHGCSYLHRRCLSSFGSQIYKKWRSLF